MRLVTCSNSGPRLTPSALTPRSATATPGGLVPILNALLDEIGGHWIYTASGVSSGEAIHETSATGKSIGWQPLALDQTLLAKQHESISIRTLLWTFHYLHDTSTAPVFGADIAGSWQAYEEVNRYFAEALIASHRNESDEIVLIHDFHLMLVPSYFAKDRRGRDGRLAYFHHVPWCEPDYFGLLPQWMVSRVLESLLNCDVVSFHCDRWAQAFLACCDRFIPEADVTDHRVTLRGHETLVTTAPGPIDASMLAELSRRPSTDRWRETLNARAGGRRIITRVDRLDLWKNVVRGFQAYELLLQRKPDLVGDIWFCAIATVPRLQTDRHKQYQRLCDDLVQGINDRYAPGREAVSLIYPEDGDSQRDRAVAALSIGTATLVNSTFDGLNMVAKEAIVVNPRAHLLLSTNAGAYSQLASAVEPIQPFDIMSTADALERAVSEEKQQDEKTIDLRDETAVGWLRAILG